MTMNKRARLEKILRSIAKRTLEKYTPTVIGITGSVGKTTTKEAVRLVLDDHFVVGASEKSFNNEIGLPLTIIGQPAGKGWWSWAMVILAGYWQLWFRNDTYPEVLVLEVGVDHPGDMRHILDLVSFDVGIVTSIGSSHMEFFKNKKALAREKLQLLKSLKKNGVAITNKDDSAIAEHLPKLRASMMTYGFDQDADISADPNISFAAIPENAGDAYSGISFKINTDNKHIPIHLPHIISRHHIYAALAAITVGVHMKIGLLDIATSLEKMEAAPGRMRLLPGIKDTWIIDDSYNSSTPEAPIAALQTLETLVGVRGRRIAVLGDMLELGEATIEAHQKVADAAREIADIVITVGERGRIIAEKLERTGFPNEQLHQFDRSVDERIDSRDPGKVLQGLLKPGDVVLVKGSQGIRTELIVEEILGEDVDPEEVLARQSRKWKKTRP